MKATKKTGKKANKSAKCTCLLPCKCRVVQNKTIAAIQIEIPHEQILNGLPILNCKSQILKCISENKVTILVGETGSGKTTQLPQYLNEAGYGLICITQPRRVAAISIAARVAEEMRAEVGKLVGYSIRFHDKTSHETKIKFVTDGMLLRELLNDSMLSKYSVIILDEAHERTLRTDVLFGALKRILQTRNNLKVIIMSATLNAKQFSEYFNGSTIINVPGRQFPVKIMYSPQILDDYLDASLVAILQIHKSQPMGDVLVFLTGQEEIENLEKLIIEHARKLEPRLGSLLICPIFASLPTEQQTKVFDAPPPNTRKIILSTNIAETSITISGIRYVIDSGMVKVRTFNSKTGIETLSVQSISKASANQRAGRSGREAPGVCYRLFPESSFELLQEETEPEIKRCNLSSVLLLLKASGIKDVSSFDFIDKPSRSAFIAALEQLYALGALDKLGELTSLGKMMAIFPIAPQFAKVLISSQEYKCTEEAITIIAMLSIEPVFFAPYEKREEAANTKKKFVNFEGDHVTLLNVFNQFDPKDWKWCSDNFINARSMRQIIDVRKQLEQFTHQMGIPSSTCLNNYEPLLQCFLTGFFKNVAIRQHDGSYQTLSRQQVWIHPSSVLFQQKAPCVMFGEWVETTRHYLRHVSYIQPSWVGKVAPQYYRHAGSADMQK